MEPLGKSLVTASGIWALLEANTTGERVKVARFVFSEEEIALDPNRTALNGWIEKDVSLYTQIDDDTVEFVCDVPPEEATHYTRSAGLLLDDGTLFMIATPPFPFPPMLRQTFKIQLRYRGAGELLEFSYLPFYETEQELALLDTAASLGAQVLQDARDGAIVQAAVADHYAFKRDTTAAVADLRARAEEHERRLREADLAILDLSASSAAATLENAKEIAAVKTYLKL